MNQSTTTTICGISMDAGQLAKLRSRLDIFVDKSAGPDGCWPWTGHQRRDGYGQINVQGRKLGAHRVAYELEHGAIPAGLFVLHKCDNRPCCNPAHLKPGTHQDNMDDRQRKGRNRPAELQGEANGSAKLTEQSVRTIWAALADGESHGSIARRFGVTRPNISAIARGDTWKGVVP